MTTTGPRAACRAALRGHRRLPVGCAVRLSARGQRAEAWQRVARPSVRRHALRGLPGQRRSDRRGRWPARARGRSVRRFVWPSRRRRAGRAPTPISASSCCWRRWRGPPSGCWTPRRHSSTDASSFATRSRRVLDETRLKMRATSTRDPAGLSGRAGPCRGAGCRGRADRHAARGDAAGRRSGRRAREYATAFETTFGRACRAARARARRAAPGTMRSSKRT